MPWRETAPGRFERDFDSLENFYRGIKAAGAPIDREHYQEFAVARISPLPSEADLQYAWKTMRFRHPLIAGFDQDGRYVYETPDAKGLQSWIDETFKYFGADKPTTLDELKLRPNPVALVHFYALEGTSELVIRTSHWRIDGIGLRDFTHAILEALANPISKATFDWSSTATLPKLTPGINEALGLPLEATPERTRNANALLNLFGDNSPSLVFETKDAQLPEATRRSILTMSEEESHQILQGCKARGITVTSGLHAALVLAGQKLAPQPTDEGARYTWTDLLIISLRKYLRAPLNEGHHPVTVWHTGLPATFDIPTERQARMQDKKALSNSSFKFSHFASNLNKFYRRNYAEESPSVFEYLAQWVDTIRAVITAPPGPDAPPPIPAVPKLSSIGLLEDGLAHTYRGQKNIELQEWCVMVEILDKTFFSWVWTFRGRISLTIAYNEAFYDLDFAQKVMQEWRATAERELA